MSKDKRRGPPRPTDPEAGIYQGRSVARRVTSEDGMTILVGRSAADNDIVTFKLGVGRDFWLHVAAGPGSHVVVRNPDRLDRLPRATSRLAAALAAKHSKGKAGGRTAVHVTTCDQVRKPRGYAPGKVTLGRFQTLQGSPSDADDADDSRRAGS